ncbi:zinc finger MYND domain-containing protein [Sporobolomyces salmoneus]|uniref:zinc finger MYND domain-containing protein n=1 Tax=Sporobolomyces salmoneus TaxID=183962 RepID=UPI00317D27FC
MSSSQPPDSSGDCVVCGKRCWTRCSACGANGTEWMYFCSTEHQTLIWFVHKRFCGVNSSPVYWPLLSESEADEAREVLKDLRREQSASGSSARPEALKDLGFINMLQSDGFERLDLERFLPQILENSDPSWPMSRQARSMFVATFRRDIFQLKVKLAKHRDSNSQQALLDLTLKEASNDPIGFALSIILDLIMFRDNSPRWFNVLLHKILIQVAILCRMVEDVSRPLGTNLFSIIQGEK